MARRLEIEGAGVELGRQIAFEDFLDALADPELIERFHVRLAVEKQDSRHQPMAWRIS